ncbi:MAG: hypothetical protein CMI61_01720 [Parvibaculum sp.]|nr:hypothetical protein [Parvibaculum sp.]
MKGSSCAIGKVLLLGARDRAAAAEGGGRGGVAGLTGGAGATGRLRKCEAGRAAGLFAGRE